MAPSIAKVDTNCQFGPGMPAWNFRDEVLRWLFHGIQSAPPPERPAHPIYLYCLRKSNRGAPDRIVEDEFGAASS
jgi:hypothetical protein